MIEKIYHKLVSIIKKIQYYYSVNWTKTLYFNFKKFPFSVAIKFPVFFYGKVKFQSIKGKITINAPIKRGMIGFSRSFEMNTARIGIAELMLDGEIIFNGSVYFGKDCFVYVKKDAVLEMGHMSLMASRGKIICTNRITFGAYTRIGSESQVMDTNFHPIINTQTNLSYPMTAPIELGSYNWLSNRVTIFSKTKTPDYCIIGSNSVCSKDYSSLGSNILIGGVPAVLVKENISRDWNAENLEL